MKERVLEHRKIACLHCPNNECPCAPNITNPSFACPISRFAPWYGEDGAVPVALKPTPLRGNKPYNARSVWRQIHTLALTDSLTAEILTDIVGTLPNCCADHWQKWLLQNPLPVKNQFAWSVEAHNAVSRRIKKPELSVEEARACF